MTPRRGWSLAAVAVLLAVLVAPVVFAGSGRDPGAAEATASASAKKKIKKLTALVKALEARVAALEGQGGGGGGDVGATAQPIGPAGGDLTGGYPDPQIAANAVGSAEIAPDAVDDVDIATEGVGAAEIAFGAVNNAEIGTNAVSADEIQQNGVALDEIASNAVGASELLDPSVSIAGTATSITDGTAENGNYTTGTSTVSCAGGEAIGGWGSWTDNAANDELFISETVVATGPDQVTVVGGNDTGAERHLVANALCLPNV